MLNKRDLQKLVTVIISAGAHSFIMQLFLRKCEVGLHFTALFPGLPSALDLMSKEEFLLLLVKGLPNPKALQWVPGHLT